MRRIYILEPLPWAMIKANKSQTPLLGWGISLYLHRPHQTVQFLRQKSKCSTILNLFGIFLSFFTSLYPHPHPRYNRNGRLNLQTLTLVGYKQQKIKIFVYKLP